MMESKQSRLQIPAELVGVIARHLNFEAKLKSRQVCRTWRQTLDREKVSRGGITPVEAVNAKATAAVRSHSTLCVDRGSLL